MCVGAGPPAPPSRRRGALVAGIELPEQPVRALRERSVAALAGLEGDARIAVYLCPCGVDAAVLGDRPGVAVIEIACVGMLPPSFIDFLLSRGHADGVMLTGCRDQDCFHRLGIEFAVQRIARARDPMLRERVARERIALVPAGGDGGARLVVELDRFQRRIAALEQLAVRRPAVAPERAAETPS